MRKNRMLFRLTAIATIAGLALPGGPAPLFAQPAPTPDAAAQQTADPPERVGRLAQLRGAVSFHATGDTQWSAASANFPVAAGYSFWTEPDAEATVELSASRIAMSGASEVDITTLDASGLQAATPQGEVYLNLRDLAPNEAWVLQTPRGTVTLNQPGRYALTAGTTDAPTLVTVLEGGVQVTGPGIDLQVGPQQTATLIGSNTVQASVGPAQRDAFVSAMLARERPAPRPAVPPPPAVAAMPGGADLSAYGAWSPAPEYGQVWYPQVAPGWVPYRDGHWAYVAPWGWTWIDDAPWGFAPFHYGRWVEIAGRWAWTPGVIQGPVVVQPVYAPALVTFFGIGAGVAVGVGLAGALAAGSIGWCPLGPREPYRPWYHASEGYVRAVNVTHVTNITTINNNVTINNFVNRGAATMAPASALVNSRPVGPIGRPVPPQTLAAARPVYGQQPLRPALTTAGVTPAVARQFSLAPAAGAPIRPPAPGPVIHAQAPAGAAEPPRDLVRPSGRPEPQSGAARPLPPLVAPGPRSGPPPIAGAPAAPRPTGAPNGGNPPPRASAAPAAVPNPPHLPPPAAPHAPAPIPHEAARPPVAVPSAAVPPNRAPHPEAAIQHPIAPAAPQVVHPSPPPPIHQPQPAAIHPEPPREFHPAPQSTPYHPPPQPVHQAAPPAQHPQQPPSQHQKRPGEP
jgi:hypothetical protein